MNYQNIYESLITKRQTTPATGYTERHHILPKSLSGSDDLSNLVVLTGREHWVAHLLLYKIHRNRQMLHACNMMAMRCEERGIAYIKSSRLYEAIRIKHAKLTSKYMKVAQKGEGNSQYDTMWICNTELEENKKISKDSDIPEDWVKGRNKWKPMWKPEKYRKYRNDRKKLKKRFYITNGVEDRFLSYEDQLPLPDGWFKGKTNYPKKLNITSKGLENKRLGCFSKRGTKYNKTSGQFV